MNLKYASTEQDSLNRCVAFALHVWSKAEQELVFNEKLGPWNQQRKRYAQGMYVCMSSHAFESTSVSSSLPMSMPMPPSLQMSIPPRCYQLSKLK